MEAEERTRWLQATRSPELDGTRPGLSCLRVRRGPAMGQGGPRTAGLCSCWRTFGNTEGEVLSPRAQKLSQEEPTPQTLSGQRSVWGSMI